MTGYLDLLQHFDPISLSEMDSVQLLNRVDNKYIMSAETLKQILPELAQNYFILEIDKVRNCNYTTVYYDSDKFQLYTQHHNGKLNRYKVRMRRYEDSDTNFFEIKFKSNKGRTIKERIKLKSFKDDLQGKKMKFLQEHVPFDPESLIPKLIVHYHRVTLVSKQMNERLTLDTGLWFENKQSKYEYLNLAIMETKQGGGVRSVAVNSLLNHHVHARSVSKYCLGIASLYGSDVRTNNFKSKFHDINKICYENC